VIDAPIPSDQQCCSRIVKLLADVLPRKPGRSRATRRTILLVEDEAFVREVTCEVLQSAGYRVLTAGSAAEALRVYAETGSGVSLLLTDVILPNQTGLTLAAILRRKDAQLKVLYVTGYAEQMNARRPEEEDFLAKPFPADVLLQKVRRLLDSTEFSS